MTNKARVPQRTPNPFPEGSPNENWRRGYDGVRHFGAPSSEAAKHWKMGRAARLKDDAGPLPPELAELDIAYTYERNGVRRQAVWMDEVVPVIERLKQSKPESLMTLIESNLREIIIKSPGTYAAYVAQTTLDAITKATS